MPVPQPPWLPAPPVQAPPARLVARGTTASKAFELAAAIRVLDPVQRGVRLVGTPGRKVNAADEPHGPRRERGLIVAEERAGAGQPDGLVVGVDDRPEVAEHGRGRTRLAEHGQRRSRPIDHRHDHGVGTDRGERALHGVRHVGRGQAADGGRRAARLCVDGQGVQQGNGGDERDGREESAQHRGRSVTRSAGLGPILSSSWWTLKGPSWLASLVLSW